MVHWIIYLGTIGVCIVEIVCIVETKSLYSTGECPNVTVSYKQKRIFFNAKFDEVCPKIDTFDLFSVSKIPKNFWPLPS